MFSTLSQCSSKDVLFQANVLPKTHHLGYLVKPFTRPHTRGSTGDALRAKEQSSWSSHLMRQKEGPDRATKAPAEHGRTDPTLSIRKA